AVPACAERLRQIVEAKAPAIDAAAVPSPKRRQSAAIRDMLPGVHHRPDQLMGLRTPTPGEIRPELVQDAVADPAGLDAAPPAEADERPELQMLAGAPGAQRLDHLTPGGREIADLDPDRRVEVDQPDRLAHARLQVGEAPGGNAEVG